MELQSKYEDLRELIRSLSRVLVMFSGGVDSTLLLKTCIDVLGKGNVLALIGSSASYPAREVEEAISTANAMGAEWVVAETSEMHDEDFVRNPKDRCYYCKRSLFKLAWDVARERGFPHIAEGSNLDDTRDFRPGRRACTEQNIVSPLLAAKLTKTEIRELSKGLNLPTYSKPSYACLASRIPYGTRIDQTLLTRIEKSEDFLRSLGMGQARVRYHGSLARIEVLAPDFPAILQSRDRIAGTLKGYGFTYVTLDLQGYRTGSMNEDLPPSPPQDGEAAP
jgi:pyridinium-3,5-biscarboxylic acid mononucleotide sulfurtransferase